MANLHRYEFVGACESILATSAGCSQSREDLHSIFDFLARSKKLAADRAAADKENQKVDTNSKAIALKSEVGPKGTHADQRSTSDI